MEKKREKTIEEVIQPEAKSEKVNEKKNPNPVKIIGLLTSGEDAPGMNAAIRAVVRTANAAGIRVLGFKRGFEGLLENDKIELEAKFVSETVQKGGTILYASSCPDFMEEEGQRKAAEICRQNALDSLIVIGGNGSLIGGYSLIAYGVNVIGIPGTIDLDVACTEYTIGFDTAVNTAMEAIDKIRDTSTSHERCSIIEVAGKTAGFNALWCGIANGAENILSVECYDGDEEKIISNIIHKRKIGKSHHLIINSESIGGSVSMAKRIEFATSMETRATILGFLQRGGSPSCKDRVYASAMGAKSVEVLLDGKMNRIIAYRNGAFTDYDYDEALAMKKTLDPYLVEMSTKLSRS